MNTKTALLKSMRTAIKDPGIAQSKLDAISGKLSAMKFKDAKKRMDFWKKVLDMVRTPISDPLQHKKHMAITRQMKKQIQ